ncbi:MAG: peptidylprolyl isomerase, partial [Deltaproteobacteria bacterium]|nr:peptidylprolyl isomerase [Deltaproteobacteria bacterium]
MLKILRQGQRWVTAFFVIAVGAGMVFYLGVGGGSGRRAPGIVVSVGEENFGLREFGRTRARRQTMLEQQLGSEFDARAMSDTLDQLAVQSLIEGAILSQQASALGMAVSKREIERSISSSPYFTAEDGRFDPRQFEAWVEYEFGNQRNFIHEQRAALLAGKFMRTVSQLAKVSEGEARLAATRRLEQVQIAFVSLRAQAPPPGFEPDAEALQAFIASQESELRALYEQRSRLYNMPEQVRARHILLSLDAEAGAEEAAAVEQRAAEILAQIREGADFAALASELSEDPGSKSNGGDLGFFARGQMTKAFEDAAFSLEPGTISEPIKTEYGYHIIRVEEHREARQRSFEDTREEIAAELMGQEVARTEKRAIADRLAEAIRGGSSLEDAARAEQLTLVRSDRIQRRPDGYIPDLGASEPVMAAAFNLQPGQSSDRVFEVDGSMVLIQVLERFAPDEAALQAAIEQERTLLASQKQQAYLSTWVEHARTRLVEDD